MSGIGKIVMFKSPSTSKELRIEAIKGAPKFGKRDVEILIRTSDGFFGRCEDINDPSKATPFEKIKDKLEKHGILKCTTWGVRGSVTTPSRRGFSTVKYGGETTCFAITTREGDIIMFDIGTGAIPFGRAIMRGEEASKNQFTIISTHRHRDHLDGMGFFAPMYGQGNEILVIGGTPRPADNNPNVNYSFKTQMGEPYFPVTIGQSGAKVYFAEIQEASYSILGGRGAIKAELLNHPNEVYGYQFTYKEVGITIATDVEHFTGTIDRRLLGLVKNSHILLYDSQYTEEEYACGKRGWGHSTIEEGIKVVKAAITSIKKEIPKVIKNIGDSMLLVGVHHDPTHDDDKLDEMQKNAQQQYPNTVLGRTDMSIYVLEKEK